MALEGLPWALVSDFTTRCRVTCHPTKVCDDCPSEEWKAVQRRGYEHAGSVESEYGWQDVTFRMDMWEKALVEYAAKVKALGGPRRLGTDEMQVSTPVRGVCRDGT
jgi:hypothetical protein